MQWKVETVNLIKEAVEKNPTAWTLRIPFMIFKNLLGQVAERAIQINDPELNILMLRLGLYEVHPQQVDDAIDRQKERLVKITA